MNYKQQQEALRNRTRNNVDNKDKKSYGKKGKSIFDFSSLEHSPTFYNTIEGYNLFDIMPFIVATKNHPQEVAMGMIDYVVEVYVHSGIGLLNNSYICLEKTFGKPCFVCQERKRIMEEEKKDWKHPDVSALGCSRKVLHNVIDLKNLDKGLQLFYGSYAYFEKELLDAVNDYKIKNGLAEPPLFSDLIDGKSISFKATAEKWGEIPYFKYKNFTLEDRTASYDPGILNMTIPLDSIFHIPTFEEVQKSYYDLEQGEENEEGIDENPNTEEQRREMEDRKETEKKTSVVNQFRKSTDQSEQSAQEQQSMGSVDEVENVQEAIEQATGNSANEVCPYKDEKNNYTFGVDCDTKPECVNCPKWEECSDKQIELKKAARRAQINK